MGVYIKGMKIPKSCVDCRFHKSIYCTLTNICTNTAQDCPLIEVPTSHGRLIDANPIMKFITDGLNNGEFGYDQIKVMGEIQYAPTIIEAEE